MNREYAEGYLKGYEEGMREALEELIAMTCRKSYTSTEIQILAKNQRISIPKKKALQLTMAHVGRAVVTANGTTLAGFIVLLFSNTTAVKNFAKVNSTALFLVTLAVLILLPALVSVLHLDGAGESDQGAGERKEGLAA